MAASSIPFHDVVNRISVDAEIKSNSNRWDAQRSLPQDLFCYLVGDLVFVNHAIIIHIFLQFCTILYNFAQTVV